MPRINFSQAEKDDCLFWYRSLEKNGAHILQGAKGYIAKMMSATSRTITERDVNLLLDYWKERGVIGEHRINLVRPESTKKSESAQRRMHNELLSHNSRLPISEFPVTSGLHNFIIIGDLHVTVGLPNDRCSWIGRFIADKKPDYVVQPGDWASMDCFSTHEKPGTHGFAIKPTFEQEFACIEDSMQRIMSEIPKKNMPVMHFNEGNHEFRALTHENNTPNTRGSFHGRLMSLFERNNWSTSPYGCPQYIQGVLFSHVLFDKMNKPMGMRKVASMLTCDTVLAHTHEEEYTAVRRINQTYKLFNTGCALPHGYRPTYSPYGAMRWDYGILMMTVEDGKVLEHGYVSMKTLERKYGA